MFLLAYRNLRARPGRTFFTAASIALGVALVFAMRLVGAAIDSTARVARESQLAGADLELVSANGADFDFAQVSLLAARAEVQSLGPTLRAREGQPQADGTFQGTGLDLLGVDPERTLNPYELAAGAFFSGPQADEVLVPALWAAQNAVAVGDDLPLTTGSLTQDYRVIGLLKTRDLFGQAPTAWLPLLTLQRILDTPGALSSISIRLRPGQPVEAAREALQTTVGRQYIVVSLADSTRPTSASESALQFASVVIFLSSAFLIYNAFSITLAERRREMGQLRALGMTRGQVLRQVLAEALLTALLGSAIGLALGWVAGLGLIQLEPEARGLPGWVFPWDGVLLGLGLGVLVTLLSTLRLARAASGVSPLEAMSRASVRARPGWYARWGWVGALGLLGVYPLAHFQALRAIDSASDINQAALIAFAPLLLLAAAALLALPAGVRGGLWLSAQALRRWSAVSPASRLAQDNLQRSQARAILTTATLTIGLLTVVTLAGVGQAFVSFIFAPGGGTDFMRHDYWLVRPDSNANVVATRAQAQAAGATVASAPPLAPDLAADLEALAPQAEVLGMGAVSLPGYMWHGWAAAADLGIFRQATAWRPREGSWAEAEALFAAGPAIALPEIVARREGLHPGDVVEIETLQGRVPFIVALVGGSLTVITRQTGEQYLNAYPNLFFVDARPGVDQTALEAQLRALARKHRMSFAVDPERELTSLAEQLQAVLNLFMALTSLSGAVAGLALATTLIASVLERQRELGTLRALGLSRSQVRALVVIEAGLLGLAGSLVGALSGLAISLAFRPLALKVYAVYLGVEAGATPALPWGVAAAGLVFGPGMAMLAALWPADRAASVNPAEAMRAEGAAGFLPPAKHLGPTGLRGLAARMPLAARLSFTIGLVFALTLAATTALRVGYERQLLEDNMRAILQRAFDLLAPSTREALGAEVTALDREFIAGLQREIGDQVEMLDAQQGSASPYEFSLVYFHITDPDHKVLLSSRPEDSGRVLTDTVSVPGSAALVRLTDWTGERAFEVNIPLENALGQRLGLARVGLSAEPVDNVIRDIVRSSLWTAVAAVAVAVILTVLFTRRALRPVAEVSQAARAVARGDLARRVPETRWDDVGQLSRAFNEMVAGLNERERMRDLFGRYLSREVSEAVLKGRVTLAGERRTITCLYVDMRGSTTFAEARAPEEVVAALNQYFEVVILATEAHGGIVNRFVGDEAVCVFGAPTAYRDHADRAAGAALAMREGLAYLNHKRAALGLPVLRFGMGLNTGEVVAGATGSEQRQEYTMIGDVMNAGARIQALSKDFPAHDILLSEHTAAAFQDHFELADLGPAELRGKSQAVRIYGLVRG